MSSELDELTNRFTGLFSRCQQVRPRPGDPAVHLWGGEVPPSRDRPQPLITGGAALGAVAAEGAGIGEAIERMQAHRLLRDGVRRATFAELTRAAADGGEPALDPARLVLFHPEQYAQPGFPFVPLGPDTPCDWLCLRGAGSGDPIWVPSEVVYLFTKGAHPHAPGLSTGLCCGPPGDALLLSGLQEVIERDALMGAWWGRYALEEWPAAQLIGADPLLAERLLRPNLDYRCYRVASPYSAQVLLCTVAGETYGGFCFSAGSACRATRTKSLRKALLEAMQGFHYARFLKEEIRTGRRRPVSPPMDFADHAVFYSLYPQELSRTPLQRARIGAAPDPGLDHPEDLATLRQRLGPARPLLFRDLTPPAIAQRYGAGTWPLSVLRVLVPGLQPLHGDDRLPMLGGPLWAPRSPREFAALPPHPFP